MSAAPTRVGAPERLGAEALCTALNPLVAVFSRLRRGISPFQGGKDHLSHRLIRHGISRRTAAILLWMLSILFGLLAVIISSVKKEYEADIIMLSILLWFLLFFGFLRMANQ